jgi:hypothetical protein
MMTDKEMMDAFPETEMTMDDLEIMKALLSYAQARVKAGTATDVMKAYAKLGAPTTSSTTTLMTDKEMMDEFAMLNMDDVE